jgi:hypothetical protein
LRYQQLYDVIDSLLAATPMAAGDVTP